MFVIAKKNFAQDSCSQKSTKIFPKKKSMKSKVNSVMASHKTKGSYFAQIYLLET
jgi:hypothetical protein